MIRLDLAKVLAEAGPERRGRREYERILARQPDYPAALTGLGALRARPGSSWTKRGRLLRRSLEVQPAQPDARFNLARVLEQQGRPAEAAAEYQQRRHDDAAASRRRSGPRARDTILRSGSVAW